MLRKCYDLQGNDAMAACFNRGVMAECCHGNICKDNNSGARKTYIAMPEFASGVLPVVCQPTIVCKETVQHSNNNV
jgi:hypothetical protein